MRRPAKPSQLNQISLFTPSKDNISTVTQRNSRLERIEAIFKSTPTWREAVQRSQQPERTTTVDELIELLRNNPRASFTDEKAPDFVFQFQEKMFNFPMEKVNELSLTFGSSVLYNACRYGWLEIVDLLCTDTVVKADGFQCVHDEGSSKTTCLHGANWGGHSEIVAYLLYKGVKPDKNLSGGEIDSYPYEEYNELVSQSNQHKLQNVWSLWRDNKIPQLKKFIPEARKMRDKYEARELENELINFRTTSTENIMEMQYSQEDDECQPSAGNTGFSSQESKSTFTINNRFQEVAEKFFALNRNRNEIPETLHELNMQFVEVSRDFLYFAKTISKVIISEAFLSDENKTIKPKNMGGTIGGHKYIVQAVLFKFARESEDGKLTGQMASKISGHELKSLSHLWECKIQDVFLPLQCMINYLGFRMIAMLLLPLDSNTLKVGSSDACRTYHSDSPSLLDNFKRIGEILNLAPHRFNNHILYGPFDLEGHIGTDNRKYIIDFSRLFPPVSKSTRYPSGYLYRLFRPEFVKRYPKPLCSDGFISIIEDQRLNEDLVEAEKYLLEQTIPKFSSFLAQFVPIVLKLEMVAPGNFVFQISRTLHEAGINVRYLGLVYFHCTEPSTRTLLLIEMAARTIKQVLREKIREKMRQEQFPLEHPYIRLLVQYINMAIFAETEESKQAWIDIEENIKSYFEMVDFCSKQDFSHLVHPLAIRDIIWEFSTEESKIPNEGPKLLFDRIKQMMGFKVNKSYLNKMFKENLGLTPIVVSSVGQRIKHMNVISHAEGWLLRTNDRELAIKKFDIARDSVPLNKYTLRNYAILYFEQYKRKDDQFAKYIKYLFSLALSEDSNDTHTLYQYGRVLFELGDTADAEEHLIQAVEQHPDHQKAWIELIAVLKTSVPLEKVKRIFRIVMIKFGKK